MHKLVRGVNHGFLNKNPKLHASPLHNRTEKTLDPNLNIKFVVNQVDKIHSPLLDSDERNLRSSHPWPEWVNLIECLGKKGCFNGEGNSLAVKESNSIRTACLNFARHRFRLIGGLSKKDIYTVVECGCPSTDRKVINSGKRLRAHVGIDEGSVCSSCNLRGNCGRAYVKAPEEKGARTVDIMRILLMYGLDPIYHTVENNSCNNTLVKESVRRLLKEIVDYNNHDDGASEHEHLSPLQSGNINNPTRRSDWTCPKCNFLNFARNIRCLQCDGLFEERVRKLRVERENLPLKKGDWICEICNFLNFANNTKCLICKEKPTKRELNPGEWECESCNYINFRKNMVCLKCDHRRPKTSTGSNSSLTSENSNRVKSVNSDVSSFKFVTGEYDEQSHPNDCSTSDDGAYGMLDFPIAGGKSSLSRDAKRRETWKIMMLERSKNSRRMGIEDDESGNANTRIETLNYLEPCDDDEEMAEWFGYKKDNMSQRSLHQQG